MDFASVIWRPRRHHVTRSVLVLEDQVLEVWDARELAQATWKFTYDYAGRRLKTEHTTGTGSRWALADATGNPIWSRDARGIEVDRTFDELNRPVDEKTDDGSTVKLRRAWSYVDYDEQDPDHDDHQDKNLYGQVEEARDADGVRFFEYDHRGLPVKASHRFWDHAWQSGTDAMWANGGSWDPEVPSTDRASVASWLTLSGLTDTTTVEITTTYDSAGRPTQVDYPESMSLRSTYDEAGHLATLELRRTSAAGFKDVLTDLTYNARGQVTGWVHGNGVETTREYDEDLERLVRIFTKLPGSPDVHFQDLAYDYDPAGNPLKLTDDVDSGGFAHNQIIPNTREYHYDPRYRLVRAKGKKHTSVTAKSTNPLITTPDINDYEPYDYRYVYDEVGNFYKNHEYSRGQLHYKDDLPDLFNGDGREAIDGERDAGNYTYDENGNTTHTPRQQEMAYTHDNQVRWVDMGGGTEVQYLRHADQRVVRFSRASSQHSLGIYLGPWEYHDKDGVYTKAVLHAEAHGRHAQAEVVLSGTDSNSLVIWYVHADHLGSGHVITKADGSLLTQEEYFPYGRASDRRDSRNRYRYIGVERDEHTRLHVTGPRFYDSVTGRFFAADPERQVDVSPYVYARSRPTSLRDPTGWEPESSEQPESVPFTKEAIAIGAERIALPDFMKEDIQRVHAETKAGSSPSVSDPSYATFEFAIPYGWGPEGEPIPESRGVGVHSGRGAPWGTAGVTHGHPPTRNEPGQPTPDITQGMTEIRSAEGISDKLKTDEGQALEKALQNGPGEPAFNIHVPHEPTYRQQMVTTVALSETQVTVRMYRREGGDMVLYDVRSYEQSGGSWSQVGPTMEQRRAEEMRQKVKPSPMLDIPISPPRPRQ